MVQLEHILQSNVAENLSLDFSDYKIYKESEDRQNLIKRLRNLGVTESRDLEKVSLETAGEFSSYFDIYFSALESAKTGLPQDVRAAESALEVIWQQIGPIVQKRKDLSSQEMAEVDAYLIVHGLKPIYNGGVQAQQPVQQTQPTNYPQTPQQYQQPPAQYQQPVEQPQHQPQAPNTRATVDSVVDQILGDQRRKNASGARARDRVDSAVANANADIRRERQLAEDALGQLAAKRRKVID